MLLEEQLQEALEAALAAGRNDLADKVLLEQQRLLRAAQANNQSR